MFILAIWWHSAVSGAVPRWWLFWRKEFCIWPQVGSYLIHTEKVQTVPLRWFSLVSLPLACGMSFYRISVGSLKENILGTCLLCGSSYDDYSSRCRCSHCRMLVLVCPTCQGSTKEYVCELCQKNGKELCQISNTQDCGIQISEPSGFENPSISNHNVTSKVPWSNGKIVSSWKSWGFSACMVSVRAHPILREEHQHLPRSWSTLLSSSS